MRALKFAILAAGAVCLSPIPCQAQPLGGLQICQDTNIEQTAIKVVGIWARQYGFTRVLIGDDWSSGFLWKPVLVEEHPDYLICRSSYTLVKGPTSLATIGGYRVGIPHFDYRVTREGTDFRVSLEDLPDGADASSAEMAKLIDRFTINDRPYAEVVKANADRLKVRR